MSSTQELRRSTLRPPPLLNLIIALVALRVIADPFLSNIQLQAWSSVFLAIVLQALPFLALGVVLSAAITTWVSPQLIARLIPKDPILAVPVAAASGVLIPGCECASIPVSHSLMRRGLPQAAGIAFLLATPAINPVVIAATWVAFPGQPQIAIARFACSLLAAMIVGWVWLARGKTDLLTKHGHAHERKGIGGFLDEIQHELLPAAGFLVVGALAAASVNIFVPREWISFLASNLFAQVAVMAVLAVVMAICSEADAFVAASFVEFSPVAKLVFMVVGPFVDLKLIALQANSFGRQVAWRLSSLSFVVAIAVAVGLGGVLL